VRARNPSGVSRYSDPDPATTVLFPDFPVVAGQTIIRADHVTRLRAAVDAMRDAAGLVTAQWSDDPLSPGTEIKSSHVTQMRTGVDAARTALGLAVSPYTDSDLLLPGSVVRAMHFNELRSRVE
jgi:hypothetical protein